MKKKNFFFLFLIIIYFYKFNSYSEEKIAFIDLNFVFNESTFGRNYNNNLNKQISNRNDKIKDYQTLINNQKIEIENKKNVISSEDYDNLVRSLENQIITFNDIIRDDQNKIDKYKAASKKKFLDAIIPLLETYSINNSIDIILKKENLLIAKNDLDITNELIILINKSDISKD